MNDSIAGTDNESWGFGGTGKRSHNRRFDDYGQSFTMGDTLGCLLDLDEKTIRLISMHLYDYIGYVIQLV